MAVLHDGVVAVSNLREFFRESIDSAIDNRHVRVDPHTSHYVVNLLTLFARSEKFYNEDNEHCGVRPVEVFRELARKFQSLVDVLNEVRDGARCSTDTDVLRTYEIWRKTGSERQRPGAAARSLMLSEIDTASPLKRRHLSDLPAHSESSPSRSSFRVALPILAPR